MAASEGHVSARRVGREESRWSHWDGSHRFAMGSKSSWSQMATAWPRGQQGGGRIERGFEQNDGCMTSAARCLHCLRHNLT